MTTIVENLGLQAVERGLLIIYLGIDLWLEVLLEENEIAEYKIEKCSYDECQVQCTITSSLAECKEFIGTSGKLYIRKNQKLVFEFTKNAELAIKEIDCSKLSKYWQKLNAVISEETK